MQAESEAGRAIVVLDDEIDGLREHLQEALGPSFWITKDSALPRALAVVVPPHVDRVEYLRASYPELLIVVYGGTDDDTVTYLEARADDHAQGCSMRVLAARLRAASPIEMAGVGRLKGVPRPDHNSTTGG
jgi:hypothetical protein